VHRAGRRRTLWSLLRHPGMLTAEWVRGARLPYMPPLRGFLLANVISFLWASAAHNNTFTTTLATHLNATRHRAVAQRLMRERLAETIDVHRAKLGVAHIGAAQRDSIVADYARRFDQTSETQARPLLIALVPLFTIFVTAVSRWRRAHVLPDVVFATHATAWLLRCVWRRPGRCDAHSRLPRSRLRRRALLVPCAAVLHDVLFDTLNRCAEWVIRPIHVARPIPTLASDLRGEMRSCVLHTSGSRSRSSR
jgi:hypothetical protein